MSQPTFAELKKRWRDEGQKRASEFGLKLKLTDFQICADELESLEQRVRELRDKMHRQAALYGEKAYNICGDELTALLGEK